ncbi:hypothetical protein BDR07DRAFT_1443986 [Suillus spraguei]|nr:hypothetical protein BDR07DRAFT_1443986 [Suillus spraguei]
MWDVGYGRIVHGIHGSDTIRVFCLWNLVIGTQKEILIVYRCGCGSTFSRRDTLNRHKRTARH